MIRTPDVCRRIPVSALACALLLCAGNLFAADAPLTIEKVTVGFTGTYKVGCWAPVVVDVVVKTPTRAVLLIEAQDPDGNWVLVPGVEHDLATAGKHQLRGICKVGRLTTSIRVRVVPAGGEPVVWSGQENLESKDSPSPRLKQSAFLIATLGKPAGFIDSDETAPDAADAATDAGGEPAQVVALDSFDDLPHDLAGFDSLDLLVIAGKYNATAEQSRRIQEWVLSGGNLIVSVGSDIAGFQAGELDAWLPVTTNGTVTLRELGVLEGFAGRGSRLLRAGETVTAAKIAAKEGEILITGFDGPLVTRAAVGLGQVTFIALDIDRPPLAGWSSMNYLARRLIGNSRDTAIARTRGQSAALAQSGMTDVSTQFLRITDEFPEVQRVSTWTVMAMMLLYLVIIGPLDYLIVHRILKRPRWTWVTFPLMVALATWLTTSAASATNGAALQVNRVDLVDIDAASSAARLNSWATVYSPETSRYKVAIDPQSIVARNNQTSALPGSAINAWRGIPEDTFGGMYRLGGITFGHAGYSLSENETEIENLPISIWSTKGVMSTWNGKLEGTIEADLSSRGPGHLTGTLRHRLRAPLCEWIIAHGRQVYRPVAHPRTNPEAKLAPLERWTVADASPRELEGFLTGTTQKYEESKVNDALELVREQVPYNRSSRDPNYVLRMLTFFQAAGGRQYVGLDHRANRKFDLTPLLGLNRAILIGRLEAPAAEVKLNGEVQPATTESTFVRIVLPVKDLRAGGPATLATPPENSGGD